MSRRLFDMLPNAFHKLEPLVSRVIAVLRAGDGSFTDMSHGEIEELIEAVKSFLELETSASQKGNEYCAKEIYDGLYERYDLISAEGSVLEKQAIFTIMGILKSYHLPEYGTGTA